MYVYLHLITKQDQNEGADLLHAGSLNFTDFLISSHLFLNTVEK